MINCVDNLHARVLSDLTEGVYVGSTLFAISDIEDSLHHLKSGKTSGLDDLSKENILYAHPAVIVHLKILFNLICAHGLYLMPSGMVLLFLLLKID